MTSFLGFGREHVTWNYEKTGNPVYLHIMQCWKLEPDEADRSLKKPTLLAIGVEGGFSDQEPECDEVFEIIILPRFFSLPFPSVDLPEKVTLYPIQEIVVIKSMAIRIGEAGEEFPLFCLLNFAPNAPDGTPVMQQPTPHTTSELHT
ncbi:hypothetical protein ABZP36_015585 [Zizania latifolia]